MSDDKDLEFQEEKARFREMSIADYEVGLSLRGRAGAGEGTPAPTPEAAKKEERPSPWPMRIAAGLSIYWLLKGQEVRAVAAAGATYYLVKKNVIANKKADFSEFVNQLLP